MGKRDKRAFASTLPATGKVPYGQVPHVEDKRPVWRFQTVDFEGPFGWISCRPRTKLREVIEKLGQFESMTWQEIEQSRSHKCHFIDVDDLQKQARDRLDQIGQGDVDQVFSLHLSGPERVFGIRDRWIFKILWWDPEHAVCKSKLKHT